MQIPVVINAPDPAVLDAAVAIIDEAFMPDDATFSADDRTLTVEAADGNAAIDRARAIIRGMLDGSAVDSGALVLSATGGFSG